MAFSDPRTASLALGALFGKSGPAGGVGQREWVQGGLSTPSSPPGAGVLVTTVVAGGIAILRPFTAASRPFLRDIVFYMVAVFLTFTALYLGRVTLAWALGEQPRGWVAHPSPGAGRWQASGAQRPSGFPSEGKPYSSWPEQKKKKKGTYGSDNQRGQGGDWGGVADLHNVTF